jgi:shikimate kinase
MKPIYLIGYRATGKTTVGRELAYLLRWQFIDADVLIEERAGKSIREIFAQEGEAGFRDRESELLREVSNRQDHVIATGGGIILREENRKLLKETGFVVWLTATAPTLWERIQADTTTLARRPNLTVGGLAEIESLMEARLPLYEIGCDYRLSTEGESPERLATAILGAWRESGIGNRESGIE